jgi:hypothetical protein
MLGAGHLRRVGFQVHPRRASIQAPPAPSSLSLVIAWPAAPTPPASAPPGPGRPDPSYQHFLGSGLLQIHPLDHRVLDP